jgi:hypothetical protein
VTNITSLFWLAEIKFACLFELQIANKQHQGITMKFLKTAALAALLATGAAHASTELLTNGSFEADLQGNGSWNIYTNLTGWIGGAYGIELRNNVVGVAPDGVNFVELDTYANSSMSQSVAPCWAKTTP